MTVILSFISMPASHPARQKNSRYTQPKPNLSKILKGRWDRVDLTTVLMAGHLIVLVTSLLTATLFTSRFLYKTGLLALIGIHGAACFKAYKANGRKFNFELVKEPALPYLLLAAMLFYLTRLPLFPLSVSFLLHSGLALMKTANSNAAAMNHPNFKGQAKQLSESLKIFDPQIQRLASHFELLAVPWSFIAGIRGSQSLLLPVFMVQFVRFLMVTQERMESAWKVWNKMAVQAVEWVEAQPAVPPSVRAVLLKTKLVLTNPTVKTE